MQTRQDNNMIDHKDAIYIKKEIELLCLIGSSALYDENMTRKWHGQFISLVYFKTELNYRDLSNWV